MVEFYPQPQSQVEGCGFPTMRIVGLFSIATGGLLEVNPLPRKTPPSLKTED